MKIKGLLLSATLLALAAPALAQTMPSGGGGGGGGGGGTVTSISGGNGILPSTNPCISTCTLNTTVSTNAQTGASYALLATDGGKFVTGANAGAQAYTISQANQTGFTAGFGTEIYNKGAGALTLTATTSTFGNALTSLVLTTGQYAAVASDGANYLSAVTLPVMAQDTVLGNAAASNYPTAMTLPSCANDGTHASIYATATHAWACASITAGAATSVAVGTTTVTSGTTTRVLFDNAGVLGEYTISGSGNVAMTTSPAFTTPSLGSATATGLNMSGTSGSILNLGATGKIQVSGSDKITFSGGSIFWGAFFGGSTTGTAGLSATAGSVTAPTIFPNWSQAGTTGLWASSAGDMSLIWTGVEKARVTTQGIQYKQATAPVPTGTGTPTIATGSTDEAGEVTAGASATSVIITFNLTHTNAPFCVVQPQTQLASWAYTLSNTAITITQPATSGNKIDYRCTFP